MNWNHHDELKHRLETMPPAEFDYRWYSSPPPCGCVYVQAQVCGMATADKGVMATDALALWLGITEPEASELFATHDEPRGTKGIAEALRRLAVVAARYQRPDAQPVTQ